MKLFLIEQSENTDYDTYDSAVVAALDEDAARNINPDSNGWGDRNKFPSWCSTPDHVTVKYIGEAADDVEQGVVLASFNAG